MHAGGVAAQIRHLNRYLQEVSACDQLIERMREVQGLLNRLNSAGHTEQARNRKKWLEEEKVAKQAEIDNIVREENTGSRCCYAVLMRLTFCLCL